MKIKRSGLRTTQKNLQALFEYLDGYGFSCLSEIIYAIEDYYYPFDGKESPSYGELSEYGEIAKDYSESRQLDLDFNEY